MSLPTITLSQMNHRGMKCVALRFPYNEPVKKHLMHLDAVKWTQTHRCFYVPETPEIVKKLEAHCLGVANLDVSSMTRSKANTLRKMLPKPIPDEPALPGLVQETRDRIEGMRRYMEQKRYSNSTINTYVSFVRHFFVRRPDIDWNGITRQAIEAYNHQYFIRGKKSYSTQNQWIHPGLFIGVLS